MCALVDHMDVHVVLAVIVTVVSPSFAKRSALPVLLNTLLQTEQSTKFPETQPNTTDWFRRLVCPMRTLRARAQSQPSNW